MDIGGESRRSTALFVSQEGHVFSRVSKSRDFLLTQRPILQPRLETNATVQRVPEFTVGRGLNNIEAGARVRYEFHRKFGPYVGVSMDRSFFGTADLVRQDGGEPGQVRLVMGFRAWY